MPSRSNSWIFQGNPQIWDVSAGVKNLQTTNWSVRQHRDKIRPSDRAYIWESGDKAGIVAVATVTEGPSPIQDTPDDRKFYPKGPPPEFQGQQLRVRIKIDKVLNPRIRKSELKTHPTLKDLNILKNPRGTNFSVTPQQADALEGLVVNR